MTPLQTQVYCYALFLWWIVFYLFLLAVFRVQFKKTKHEVIGLVTVLVTPLNFAWVVPWKMKDDDAESVLEHQVQLCVIYAPVLVCVLITIVAIGTSSLNLLRGALNRDDTYSLLFDQARRHLIPFSSL